jgi:hypothetical protein
LLCEAGALAKFDLSTPFTKAIRLPQVQQNADVIHCHEFKGFWGIRRLPNYLVKCEI